jgi:hypothetical protein
MPAVKPADAMVGGKRAGADMRSAKSAAEMIARAASADMAAASEAATHVAATTREAAAHMAAPAAEAATMAASAAEAATMTASATSTMTASAPATPASPGVSRQGRRSKGRGPDGDRCNQHDCSMQCDSLHSDSPFHSLVEPAYAMQSAQTMMVGYLGAPPAVVVPLLPALTDNCDIRCFRRRRGAPHRACISTCISRRQVGFVPAQVASLRARHEMRLKCPPALGLVRMPHLWWSMSKCAWRIRRAVFH